MPPALVLAFPEPTALGVIRSLGRNGIPHIDVGTRGSFVSCSRWHRPWPDLQGNEPSPASLPQFLAGLPIERMALIPCTDQWVAAVAGLDSALAARFPASVARPETIQTLLDKGRFAEVAAHLGVPHPRTISLGSPGDLSQLPDTALQHTFLKPRNSKAFLERYGVKAARFTTRSEAVAFAREARRAGLDLILQEHIPGPATRRYSISGFVDRRGTVCASFAYRWLRRHPRDLRGHCGACAVTIPLEEMNGSVHALKGLLAAIGYRGVFNAQFKYDERDGQFKILEVNPRPWTWVGFALACGVDVVEMAYRDALGLSVKPVTEYEVGRYALDPFTDLVAGWQLFREGRLTLGSWLRSWLVATQLTFCWDDPVPALGSFFDAVRGIFRRRVRVRRLPPEHARDARRAMAHRGHPTPGEEAGGD